MRAAKKMAIPISKKFETMHIRLPTDVVREIKKRASHEDRSPTGYARYLLLRALYGLVNIETIEAAGDED